MALCCTTFEAHLTRWWWDFLESTAGFYIAFVGKLSFSEYSGHSSINRPSRRQSTNGAIKMVLKNLKLLWVRLPDAGELS